MIHWPDRFDAVSWRFRSKMVVAAVAVVVAVAIRVCSDVSPAWTLISRGSRR